MLAQQLSLKRAHEERRTRAAPVMPRRCRTSRNRSSARFLQTLPFKLTGAQQRVCAEIARRTTLPHPMQRLLQGDVGSGKTMVAALAAAQAIDAGYQAALMAPTEILAEQHVAQARRVAGTARRDGRVADRQPEDEGKARRAEAAASGAAQLVIGTHALIQDAVRVRAAGSRDRRRTASLRRRPAARAARQGHKAADGARDFQPHQLMMSATPIPRTLAMTYYADLDVSMIDELPPGPHADR